MPPPALGYMFVCLERLLEHGSGRHGGESQCIFSNKGCENLLLSWTREEEERFKVSVDVRAVYRDENRGVKRGSLQRGGESQQFPHLCLYRKRTTCFVF